MLPLGGTPNLGQGRGCGAYISSSTGKIGFYRVEKFKDILEKIIPFFKKYPIKGIKAKDFSDFCIVSELMIKKEHLTQEGFTQILKIKSNMNDGRS